MRRPKGYWTYDMCKEEALKYSNLNDLLGTYLYKIIKKNRWDILLSHTKISKKPNGYWTYERCKEESIKYDKKNIFQKEKSSV